MSAHDERSQPRARGDAAPEEAPPEDAVSDDAAPDESAGVFRSEDEHDETPIVILPEEFDDLHELTDGDGSPAHETVQLRSGGGQRPRSDAEVPGGELPPDGAASNDSWLIDADSVASQIEDAVEDVWGDGTTEAQELDGAPARECADQEELADLHLAASYADEVELLDEVVDEVEEEVEVELESGPSVERAVFSVPWLYLTLTAGLIGLAGVALAIGWPYYVTPISRRALHHLHDALRPSGPVGLTLGVAGTSVMVLSMSYILRKRLASWRSLGSLRSWMGFHVFTGLAGPAIILFHAAFIPTSAIGLLALTAMAVVLASGIIGRFIHRSVPKSLEGSELGSDDLRHRIDVYRVRLEEFGVDPRVIPADMPEERRNDWLWVPRAIAGVILGDRSSRAEFELLRESIASSTDLTVKKRRARLVARKLCRERQWLHRHRELEKLMGAWRFFHRWLAIVLFIAVAYHVAVAVEFGDLWIVRVLKGGQP